MNDELFWQNLTIDDFGSVSLDDFSAMALEPFYDPPYVASGYVSGVCNHEVVIISN